jgi:hypothetical protein
MCRTFREGARCTNKESPGFLYRGFKDTSLLNSKGLRSRRVSEYLSQKHKSHKIVQKMQVVVQKLTGEPA